MKKSMGKIKYKFDIAKNLCNLVTYLNTMKAANDAEHVIKCEKIIRTLMSASKDEGLSAWVDGTTIGIARAYAYRGSQMIENI